MEDMGDSKSFPLKSSSAKALLCPAMQRDAKELHSLETHSGGKA